MIRCPKCRASLEMDDISFKDDCPSCRTDLHACVYCKFYDEGKSNRCREPQADYVKERDRANFCEYFRFQTREEKKGAGKEEAERLWRELFKK